MSNQLLIPLYAKKPQRKIAGTDFVSVLMWSMGPREGGIREYVIFTADGERLGQVYWHSKSRIWPACYTERSIRWNNDKSWRTLADYAQDMAQQKGLS